MQLTAADGTKGKSGRADLNLLVIFRAVARRRSVTLAADDVALSQPAVSHAINRLRDVVKDPLFVRSAKGLVLTPKGEALLSAVDPALSAIERAISGEDFDPARDERTFVVCAGEYGAQVVLPRIFDFMHKEAPHCRVMAVHCGENSLEDLASGRIDALFLGDTFEEPGFEHRVLLQEKFVVLLARDHPALGRDGQGPLDLESYLAYPHAHCTVDPPAFGPVDRVLAAAGLKRTVKFASASFGSPITAVESGDVLYTLPSRLESMFITERVTSRPMPIYVPPCPYRLIWHPRSNSDSAVRWFCSRVIAEFQIDGLVGSKIAH